MFPVDEIMVKIFLPSIRAIVAKKLSTKKLSETKISKILGITQASVSMYLNSDYSKYFDKLKLIGIEKEEADRFTDTLTEILIEDGKITLNYMMEFWQKKLASGAVCPYHVRLYPVLKGCDYCIKLYSTFREELERIKEEVKEAVKILENSKYFTSLIPQVYSNLGRSTGNAKSTGDVVAIPGRIVKVSGKAKASAEPAAGASGHIARVLLIAKGKNKDINAVINIKYDERIKSLLSKLKANVIEIGEPYVSSDDPVASTFMKKLSQWEGDITYLADRGGKGMEPNLYVFGKDSFDVVSKVLTLAEMYSRELLNP